MRRLILMVVALMMLATPALAAETRQSVQSYGCPSGQVVVVMFDVVNDADSITARWYNQAGTLTTYTPNHGSVILDGTMHVYTNVRNIAPGPNGWSFRATGNGAGGDYIDDGQPVFEFRCSMVKGPGWALIT